MEAAPDVHGAELWNGQRSSGGGQSFFKFLGWQECVVKGLRIQRKLFRDDRRELTRNEYERLLAAAHGLGREPAGSADGDHLCHRNPCQRGAVYYGRGGSLGPG